MQCPLNALFMLRRSLFSRRGRSAPFGAVFLLLAWLIPSTTVGFALVQSEPGAPIAWPESSAPVFLDVRSVGGFPVEEVAWAVQDALLEWNAVSCSAMHLDYAGLVVESPGFGITIHALEPGTAASALAEGAAGVTDTYHDGTGVIYRADIHLSGDSIWALNGGWMAPGVVDVQAVVTHELGHAMGLAHSREREATMYFAGGAVALRSLELDDQRALCTLHPSEDVPAGESCDSCVLSDDCASGSCLVFPSGGAFCALECIEHADCAGGFSCLDVPGEPGSRCLPSNGECAEAGASIAIGEYCYGAATCDSGRCLVTPQGAYCTEECSTEQPAGCDADLACVGFAHSTCDGIAPEECGMCTIVGKGEAGELCWDASDCAEGVCLSHETGGHCGAFCVEPGSSCPQGTQCSLGICATGGIRPTGAPCTSPFQCEGAFCTAGLGGEDACAELCEDSGSCPFNATCLTIEETPGCTSDDDCPLGACWIPSGQCSCDGNSQCGLGLECGPSEADSAVQVCQRRVCVGLKKKGKIDEFCDGDQGCFGELACDLHVAEWGRCRPICSAFSENACAEGTCRWVGMGDTEDVLLGACSVRTGEGLGASCDSETPCAPDLLCVAETGDAGECHEACPLGADVACSQALECLALIAAEFDEQGVCAPASTEWHRIAWDPEAMPAPAPANPLPVGGARFDSAGFSAIESAGSSDGSGEGCGHGSSPAPPGAMWWLCAGMSVAAGWRRRHA
jgi:hypothetical protein